MQQYEQFKNNHSISFTTQEINLPTFRIMKHLEQRNLNSIKKMTLCWLVYIKSTKLWPVSFVHDFDFHE